MGNDNKDGKQTFIWAIVITGTSGVIIACISPENAVQIITSVNITIGTITLYKSREIVEIVKAICFLVKSLFKEHIQNKNSKDKNKDSKKGIESDNDLHKQQERKFGKPCKEAKKISLRLVSDDKKQDKGLKDDEEPN